jgi:predicted 3-demethylubiquinone-9 3-methyltransferase (glyoxalase superfamily)
MGEGNGLAHRAVGKTRRGEGIFPDSAASRVEHAQARSSLPITTPHPGERTMFDLQHKITPFLWYDTQAEEASALYIRLFGQGRVLQHQRWSEGTPYPAGSTMAVTFELAGQNLIAFNGGSHFKFSPAASLFVVCDDQAEVDRLWNGLTADGGAESQCGWLQDRFGLSWQIVPRAFLRMMSDPDPARVTRVTQAMLQMTKFDVAALQRAYEHV